MQGWQRMGKMEDNCTNVILCVTMKGRHRTIKKKKKKSNQNTENHVWNGYRQHHKHKSRKRSFLSWGRERITESRLVTTDCGKSATAAIQKTTHSCRIMEAMRLSRALLHGTFQAAFTWGIIPQYLLILQHTPTNLHKCVWECICVFST